MPVGQAGRGRGGGGGGGGGSIGIRRRPGRPPKKRLLEDNDNADTGGGGRNNLKNKKTTKKTIETSSNDNINDDDEYQCSECQFKSKKSLTAERHIIVEHYGMARLNGQSLAQLSFNDNERVQAYIRACKVLKILRCNICMKTFKTGLGFKFHMDICGKSEDEVMRECEICGKRLKVHSLSIHIKTLHMQQDTQDHHKTSQKSSTNSDIMIEDDDDTSSTTTTATTSVPRRNGRPGRVTAMKALKKFKKFNDDNDDEDDDQEKSLTTKKKQKQQKRKRRNDEDNDDDDDVEYTISDKEDNEDDNDEEEEEEDDDDDDDDDLDDDDASLDDDDSGKNENDDNEDEDTTIQLTKQDFDDIFLSIKSHLQRVSSNNKNKNETENRRTTIVPEMFVDLEMDTRSIDDDDDDRRYSCYNKLCQRTFQYRIDLENHYHKCTPIHFTFACMVPSLKPSLSSSTITTDDDDGTGSGGGNDKSESTELHQQQKYCTFKQKILNFQLLEHFQNHHPHLLPSNNKKLLLYLQQQQQSSSVSNSVSSSSYTRKRPSTLSSSLSSLKKFRKKSSIDDDNDDEDDTKKFVKEDRKISTIKLANLWYDNCRIQTYKCLIASRCHWRKRLNLNVTTTTSGSTGSSNSIITTTTTTTITTPSTSSTTSSTSTSTTTTWQVPRFKTTTMIETGNNDYQVVHPLQSINTGVNSFAFHVGHAVSCVAWCPLPLMMNANVNSNTDANDTRPVINDFVQFFNTQIPQRQYLAIATTKCFENNLLEQFLQSKTDGDDQSTQLEENYIQIWDMGVLVSQLNTTLNRSTTTSKQQPPSPHLALNIAHHYGTILEMCWTPFGSTYQVENFYDDHCNDHQTSSDRIPRLGLLAIACEDGFIRLWSIPHPHKLSSTSGGGIQTLETPPSVLTLATRHISLHHHQSIWCNTIAWRQEWPQDALLGGYQNGIICLWKLTKFATCDGNNGDSSNQCCINQQKQQQQQLKTTATTAVWYPHTTFQNPRYCPIISIRWLNEMMFITTSIDTCRIWHLAYPDGHYLEYNRNVEQKVEIHPLWYCSAVMFDMANNRMNNLITMKNFLLNNVEQQKKLDVVCQDKMVHSMANLSRNRINDISLSPWQIVLAYGTDNGELYSTQVLPKPFRHPKKMKSCLLYNISLGNLIDLTECNDDGDGNDDDTAPSQSASSSSSKVKGRNKQKATASAISKILLNNNSVDLQLDYTDFYLKYFFLFNDAKTLSLTNTTPSTNRPTKNDFQRYYSVTTCAWNPNLTSFSWLFSATKSGLCRLNSYMVINPQRNQ